MDPEETKDTSKDFGKVIDALHEKHKLSALRTYKGDVAEFIKSKDESIISIAVKEKERKEDRAEEKIKEEKKDDIHLIPKTTSNKQGFQINLTILLLSIFLIGGGVLASFYIFNFIKTPTQNNPIILKEEIIPYNNSITLANVTNENLGSELAKLSPANGISIVKISDTNGVLFLKAKDFFNFLKISLPGALERTLQDQYIVGIISQNNENSYFMVITVNDFGGAFSAMLEWEESMAKDLSFLNAGVNTTSVASITASTTIPMKPEVFNWKDIIIKNKDTRGLVNAKDKSKIAYTFLDKNTILITNNISAIGEISSVYASRSVAR